MNNPSIQIFRNSNESGRHAAQIFIDIARKVIRERGRFLVALSGGNTPVQLYQLLGDQFHDLLDWSRVHFFWGDERCVPVDDMGNSYGQTKKVFLDKVLAPAENVHRIRSDIQPAEASKEYAGTLRAFREAPYDWPRFDLVLLGLGEDGHTASLFPGSPVDVDSPTLAVTANYQGRPANRVTLTPKVFNAAWRIMFLVSGESKAEILARVLDDKNYQPELYPAQRIHPFGGEVTWLIDEAAASKLPREMKMKFCEG
jgi:6-phosphogluconolactonase